MKNLWLSLERTVEKRDRTAKKVITLQMAITTKGLQFFFGKNRNDTVSCRQPWVTPLMNKSARVMAQNV